MEGKKEKMKTALFVVLFLCLSVAGTVIIFLLLFGPPSAPPAPTPVPEDLLTSLVPTPTPSPKPTLTPEPSPTPTPTPTPRRGGPHYRRTQQQPSLNLVVCDQNGENCKEGSVVPVYFELGNVAPGNSGSTELTLKNTGSIDGKASINITNVVNGPGITPEPEPLPDNGELDKNLYVNVTADGLIAKGYVSDLANQNIDLGTLKAGNLLPVKIEWKIPEQVGNEIQGDELSFDIEFRLVGG